ncbi:MAG: hypothetical protein U9P38_02450 [Campylobacterota bacterium]|nr:hypothetical protein [Campylobacterota bacterium]
MFTGFSFTNAISKEEDIENTLNSLSIICKEQTHQKFLELDICDYHYSIEQAMQDLDLDKELIEEFLDAYVIQILGVISQFEEYFEELRDNDHTMILFDYSYIRNLAHKNLGVARNLRIKDAEKLLNAMMKTENLEYLEICLEALELFAIRLRPTTAYDFLKSK